MYKLVFALMAFMAIPNANATKLSLDPVQIPTYQEVVTQTENLDKKELKKVAMHYRSLLSTMISFLELTTGVKPSKPYLSVEFSKQDIADNLQSTIKKAREIQNDVNLAIEAQKESKFPIQIVINEIALKNKDGSCSAQPITEILRLGEIHRFTVTCKTDEKRYKQISTSFMLSFSSDLAIRSSGIKIIPVDILTNQSKGALASPSNSQDIDLSLMVSYKPL